MNWGNRLIIVFILFATLIGTMVYRSMRASVELVSKDYYREELAYQQVIEGKNNTAALSARVKIKQTGNGLLIALPEEMKGQPITGTVWFYCPSNSAKDRKLPLEVDDKGLQLIPASLPGSGNYIVKLNWQQGNKHYIQEDPLTIPQ